MSSAASQTLPDSPGEEQEEKVELFRLWEVSDDVTHHAARSSSRLVITNFLTSPCQTKSSPNTQVCSIPQRQESFSSLRKISLKKQTKQKGSSFRVQLPCLLVILGCKLGCGTSCMIAWCQKSQFLQLISNTKFYFVIRLLCIIYHHNYCSDFVDFFFFLLEN